MIRAGDLARRLADLEPIGLRGDGTTRLAWTPEDAAAGEWFRARAAEVGLTVHVDPAGNRWAVPDGATAVVGRRIAPRQRARRRAL